MIYRKSAGKVTAMVITCIFIMVTTIILIIITSRSNKIISATGIIMANFIVFSFITFSKIKPQYKQALEMNKRIIFHDRPDSTFVEFNEIESITYSGIKYIPMSEMLLIKSKSGTIYVDFNFKNYLTVWKDVICTCKKNNPYICIDIKVRKRLKIE